MVKLWENAKLVLNFEDAENEKLVRQTLGNLVNDPTDEEIQSVALAIDALSELPFVHVVVTQSHRLIY